jgi:hypothetical protein
VVNDVLVPCLAETLTDITVILIDTTFSSPADFLKAIGRSSETKVSIEGWEDFWKTSGYELKKSGVAVRDRRYACPPTI